MENRRFHVGSMAVLFAIVLLCVAVFAALSVTTALADEKTAQRYGQHVQQQYDCENAGQQWLAKARAFQMGLGPMPEGSVQQENGDITTCIRSSTMELNIRLNAAGQIERWSCAAVWQPEEHWQLWQ